MRLLSFIIKGFATENINHSLDVALRSYSNDGLSYQLYQTIFNPYAAYSLKR